MSNLSKGLVVAGTLAFGFVVGTMKGFMETATEKGNFKDVKETYRFCQMCKTAGDKYKLMKDKITG